MPLNALEVRLYQKCKPTPTGSRGPPPVSLLDLDIRRMHALLKASQIGELQSNFVSLIFRRISRNVLRPNPSSAFSFRRRGRVRTRVNCTAWRMFRRRSGTILLVTDHQSATFWTLHRSWIFIISVPVAGPRRSGILKYGVAVRCRVKGFAEKWLDVLPWLVPSDHDTSALPRVASS